MPPASIIAEIGQAHDGSVGILHSYIDVLAQTGVDAVKFQLHIAQAESSPHEPFRVPFSYVDASRYDYWQRMELPPQQWRTVKEHCDRAGVEFLVSPFSVAAVELLEQLDIERYKIGSGEIGNFLMLDRIARTGKPVILSSGLSGFDDLDAATAFLAERGVPYSILQCTTRYPTEPEDLGLNVLAELRQRYRVPVGFSDHSGKPWVAHAAAALGAEIIEFHAVFDRRMFGPDAAASLTIDEIAQVVEGIRYIGAALDAPVDKNRPPDGDLQTMFGKSLAVNRALPAGHTLEIGDLESKKPGDRGIPSRDFERVLGRKLSCALSQWAFLCDEDLANP